MKLYTPKTKPNLWFLPTDIEIICAYEITTGNGKTVFGTVFKHTNTYHFIEEGKMLKVKDGYDISWHNLFMAGYREANEEEKEAIETFLSDKQDYEISQGIIDPTLQ